ncbi:hypothetical protein L1887_61164 [Cichorium endivia]|nr:hypothetical protein L1887_61164 [Cichorium endivia]
MPCHACSSSSSTPNSTKDFLGVSPHSISPWAPLKSLTRSPIQPVVALVVLGVLGMLVVPEPTRVRIAVHRVVIDAFSRRMRTRWRLAHADGGGSLLELLQRACVYEKADAVRKRLTDGHEPQIPHVAHHLAPVAARAHVVHVELARLFSAPVARCASGARRSATRPAPPPPAPRAGAGGGASVDVRMALRRPVFDARACRIALDAQPDAPGALHALDRGAVLADEPRMVACKRHQARAKDEAEEEQPPPR